MRKAFGSALLLAALLFALTLFAVGCAKVEDTKSVVILNPESASQETVNTAQLLSGSWYGWWAMADCTGNWKSMSGCWWDCCARVTPSGDELSILIWDEDTSVDKPLAELSAELSGDAIYCTGGSFLSVKAPSNCKITLSDSGGDGLLVLTGTFYDSKTGSFRFSLQLRPWGELWSEEDLPYYYESWYLPLIEKGSSMPDTIGK